MRLINTVGLVVMPNLIRELLGPDGQTNSFGGFNTPQDATEAALLYTLENLV